MINTSKSWNIFFSMSACQTDQQLACLRRLKTKLSSVVEMTIAFYAANRHRYTSNMQILGDTKNVSDFFIQQLFYETIFPTISSTFYHCKSSRELSCQQLLFRLSVFFSVQSKESRLNCSRQGYLFANVLKKFWNHKVQTLLVKIIPRQVLDFLPAASSKSDSITDFSHQIAEIQQAYPACIYLFKATSFWRLYC